MTNLVRNNYSSFSKPCLKCKYNQGGNLCEIYGLQNSGCQEYSKWENSKKDAYSVKMPISLDSSIVDQDGEKTNQSLDITDNYSYIDYESSASAFHESMKLKLSTIDWKVYNLLYIENLDEIETAKLIGYKTSEKNRSPGYKQIKKIKNKIYKIAKQILLES